MFRKSLYTIFLSMVEFLYIHSILLFTRSASFLGSKTLIRISMDDTTRHPRNGKQGSWWLRRVMEATVVVLISIVWLVSSHWELGNKGTIRDSGICQFPTIYNFGDSNSDTGGRSAAFHRVPSPHGSTFFGHPSGRFSDGRVIIDFIAEKLGLPFLSPYLDSLGSDFQHGVNFAIGGSTIQPIDGRAYDAKFSPISLDLQLSQFQQLKARTEEFYESKVSRSGLPRLEDFSTALYTLDIGQNDLFAVFRLSTEEQVTESLPNIIDRLASAIEQLYEQGARAFWIHNTGPLGCLPFIIKYSHPKPENVDQYGCVKSFNEIAQEFNRQLKERIVTLRAKLADAMLTYVDIYSVKHMLIIQAEEHGFIDPLGYCCGNNKGGYHVHCGMKTVVDGVEVVGDSCRNASEYISWDGGHYSDAANQWTANKIMDGSFSDPPVPIEKSCPMFMNS